MVDDGELRGHDGVLEDQLVLVMLGGDDVEQLVVRGWQLREVEREGEDGVVVVEDRDGERLTIKDAVDEERRQQHRSRQQSQCEL